MPGNQKTGVDSFSKLRELMSKASPRALLKSVPNSFQKIKAGKQEKELEGKLAGVDERNAELESIDVESKKSIKDARLESLKQIYATMESMGVDPGDLNSIAEFREKLMQEDPDLAELFFKAFDTLTQGLEADIVEEAPPEDLLGRSTTNLQEPILRQQAPAAPLPKVPPGLPIA